MLAGDKKYRQISELIRSRIDSGFWGPGTRLPPYRTLAREFGVTLVTLSNAIRELELDGWLRRHPGKGVYVNHSDPQTLFGDNRNLMQIGVMLGVGSDLFDNLRNAMALKLEPQGRFQVIFNQQLGISLSEIDHRIRCFIKNDFESVVVYGHRHFLFRTLQQLRRKIRQLNFVAIRESELCFPDSNCVFFDYKETGRVAARYLLSCGQRRFGIIVPGALPERDLKRNGAKDIYVEKILEGFAEVLHDARVDPRSAELMPFPLFQDHPQTFFRRLEEFCRKGGGIFASADALIPQIYKLARRLGLTIGGDLNLIGLYNTPWCEILYPELTSICIHEEQIGEAAADCILNRLKNEHIIVQPSLVKRQT